MEVIKEPVSNYDQMAIMEQYEKVIAYLYPIAQSIPRRHGIARDMFLKVLFGQAELFYEAGKTNQIGKVYIADAGLAQHALIAVLEPIFEATFLPNTFACRAGLGTHAGVKYIQSQLRKEPYPQYYLKTDFSKFFPSVNHNILLEMVHRKITCKLTLKLIEEIIKPNEVGIPIGSLTSQLFANVYGSLLDNYIHHELGYRKWARYMDDVVILSNDKDKLVDDFYKIAEFSGKNMGMRISKWHCAPTASGINFLGYRIWHNYKLLRKESVMRAKKKIAQYVKYNDNKALDKFLASWRGHASWSNSYNLYTWLEKKHENNYQY